MSELAEGLKPLLTEFLAHQSDLLKEDLEEFGKPMAKHFAEFLMKAYAKGEESYEADIRHLRAQAEILMADYRVNLAADLRQFVIDGLEIVAQIGLKLLKTQLPIV